MEWCAPTKTTDLRSTKKKIGRPKEVDQNNGIHNQTRRKSIDQMNNRPTIVDKKNPSDSRSGVVCANENHRPEQLVSRDQGKSISPGDYPCRPKTACHRQSEWSGRRGEEKLPTEASRPNTSHQSKSTHQFWPIKVVEPMSTKSHPPRTVRMECVDERK